MDWMDFKSWAEKSRLKSASVTDQDNQLLVDIWAEEDHLQEEREVIEEDHTLAHLMESTEDAENIQVKEKESTEIVIVNIKKVKEETEIDQDLERRSTEKEGTADQILQENECSTWSLYHESIEENSNNSSNFLSTFQTPNLILSTFQINQFKYFIINQPILHRKIIIDFN